MAAELVKVPDLLRTWPWERHLNKNYEVAKAASLKWIEGFQAFDPQSQDAFNRCDFAKLAMLAYRFDDSARCQISSDLMTLFYAFDEYTDVEDELVTRQMADILMDGLRNPDKPRPKEECPLGEMARQFWTLARDHSTPMCTTHFISTMQLYVDAVVQQSADRMHDTLRSIDSYWSVRRHSSGCLPSFALIELDMDLPDAVYDHPLLETMRRCALYVICAGNDLYSYNVERARGHALHNLVTIVMHQLDLGPQAAADWIAIWSDGVVREFLECKKKLPSWGGYIDVQVARYVEGLAAWVRGNDDWSFESQRYFGAKGEEVRRVRELYMLPRIDVLDSRSVAHRDEVDNVDSHAIAAMQIRRDLQIQAVRV